MQSLLIQKRVLIPWSLGSTLLDPFGEIVKLHAIGCISILTEGYNKKARKVKIVSLVNWISHVKTSEHFDWMCPLCSYQSDTRWKCKRSKQTVRHETQYFWHFSSKLKNCPYLYVTQTTRTPLYDCVLQCPEAYDDKYTGLTKRNKCMTKIEPQKCNQHKT